MDKYLIRKPREKQERAVNSKQEPSRKQATIESLGRVVIVERVVKLKDELLNEATPAEQIISALNELERRTPSKEVLIETKVGHVVNRLRKHSNAEIKEKARIVLKKWKSFYREISTRQPLEVRADLKTERFRIKSRNLLGKALDVEATLPVVVDMERMIYTNHKSCNFPYRRQVRTIYMKINNNVKLKEQIGQGKMTTQQIINIGVATTS